MLNRKREAPKPVREVAAKERDRAAAYARMTKHDFVESKPPERDYPVAPNGRPYDPISGRYMDR